MKWPKRKELISRWTVPCISDWGDVWNGEGLRQAVYYRCFVRYPEHWSRVVFGIVSCGYFIHNRRGTDARNTGANRFEGEG